EARDPLLMAQVRRLAFLGAPALQEEAHLAADHAHRLQHARVGLAHGRAGEAHHAEGLGVGDDREYERAALQRSPCVVGARGAARSRVLADVADPERFAGLPYRSGQALSSAVGDAARLAEEILHRGAGSAPAIA